MQIVESQDDVDLGDIQAPQVFVRNFEWMTFEDTGIRAEELPRPTTWHVLIMPKQPRKMTKGGIALPERVQDVEAHQNYIGQVVAMGPLAGRHEKYKNPRSMRCAPDGSDEVEFLWNVQIGDWTTYGKYSGQHIEYRGTRFLMINDDDILSVIDSPAGFQVLV